MTFFVVGSFLLGGVAGMMLTCIIIAAGKEDAEQAASMIYTSGYKKGVDDFAARMANVDVDTAVFQIYLMGAISIGEFLRRYSTYVADDLKDGDRL